MKNLVSAEEIQVDINHLRRWIIACVATITPQTCWSDYVMTAMMCAVPQAGTNFNILKSLKINVKFAPMSLFVNPTESYSLHYIYFNAIGKHNKYKDLI